MSRYYDEIQNFLIKDEKQIERLLLANYTKALKDIKVKIKDYLVRYEDLSSSQIIELNRFKTLEAQINKFIDDLYDANNSLIMDHANKSYTDAYYGMFYQLENETKLILSFSFLDEDYIKKAIQMPIEGLRLSERLYDKHLLDMKIKTKATLQNGLTKALGYKKIAKDLSEISVADYKKSLRIAITEGGRLKSLARQDSYVEAENIGIKLQKKWLSTLDKKTRDTHKKLDGVTIGVNEDFSIRGITAPGPRLFGVASEDIHCRCDTITIVEDIEPSIRKDNETKEYVKYKNYDEWYSSRVGE